MAESPFRKVLARTLEHAVHHLDELDTRNVGARSSLAELRARFAGCVPDGPSDPVAVVDELVQCASDGILASAGGRFFGWVIGGSLPSALAADWLTSTWDNNSTLYATCPAAAVVEEACGRWLKDLLGIPESASYAITTGSQMSHAVGLAAARQALLERRGWDVNAQGLCGAPPIRILTSIERHGSVERAARLLGYGTRSLVELPVNDAGQLMPSTLSDALTSSPEAPTVVVLNAGDLNIGAFDPFEELVPLAHEAGAWVHVDGAFGLWMAAAPSRLHLLCGAERADSWATDGHKMLNVPFDAGYVFVRHPEAHRSSLSHRAAYLSRESDARDAIDWTPEWSRRGRGFATYAAIRQLGRSGLADMVEGFCQHAHALVSQIGALPGAAVVRGSEANQGLVRFLDDTPGATERDHDAHTDAVVQDLQVAGEAFFTATTWRGRRAMRISVCNWHTTARDVARAVRAVSQSQARVRAAVSSLRPS